MDDMYYKIVMHDKLELWRLYYGWTTDDKKNVINVDKFDFSYSYINGEKIYNITSTTGIPVYEGMTDELLEGEGAEPISPSYYAKLILLIGGNLDTFDSKKYPVIKDMFMELMNGVDQYCL